MNPKTKLYQASTTNANIAAASFGFGTLDIIENQRDYSLNVLQWDVQIYETVSQKPLPREMNQVIQFQLSIDDGTGLIKPVGYQMVCASFDTVVTQPFIPVPGCYYFNNFVFPGRTRFYFRATNKGAIAYDVALILFAIIEFI
ncbi:MAG: hypothetical protein ABR927_18000 [Bacteroidales bacterium]|jgi:hypothetical protein